MYEEIKTNHYEIQKAMQDRIDGLTKQNADLLAACQNAWKGIATLEHESGAAWEVARMLHAAITKAEGRDDA